MFELEQNFIDGSLTITGQGSEQSSRGKGQEKELARKRGVSTENETHVAPNVDADTHNKSKRRNIANKEEQHRCCSCKCGS